MAKVDVVYYGARDAMVAEVSAWNPLVIGISKRECKYLVMAMGDVQFDTEWFSSQQDARACAKELANVYDARICVV